jgi:hypothetical protein
MIFGLRISTTLTQFQSISDGSFQMTLGGVTNVVSGLNFSSAVSLAGVAAIIQAGINAKTGTMWTAATVAYNAVRGSFDFVGGSAEDAIIDVANSGVGTNLLPFIGWEPGIAVFSDGSVAQSITDTLSESSDGSNNFGSFIFIPSLTINEIQEAATWNNSQNILYQYYVPVTISNSASYHSVLKDYAGVGLTISEIAGEYPEQLPAAIMAATNYSAQDSVQNYMYQFSELTPSVSDTSISNQLDVIRTNYYGRTQQAGVYLDFYQRGVLFGEANDPLDMNTYANEQWLKDAAGAQIMSLFLALPRISANKKGVIVILTALQDVIDRALFNGCISLGKPLNATQKSFITEITGDDKAWYQVQNSGYWINCVIVQEFLEYKAVYTLIYTKDDAIRKVEGSHILI